LREELLGGPKSNEKKLRAKANLDGRLDQREVDPSVTFESLAVLADGGLGAPSARTVIHTGARTRLKPSTIHAIWASVDRYLAPRDSFVLTVAYVPHAPVAQLDRAAAF
jgi:hypothetical protein